MGKGINIEFVSDVRKFLGGTKDVEKALDDVSGSLDDLTRDATKAGEKVGDELQDGAEKAEDAGKKLERKFRDALDTVKDDSRKAGDDLGDNIKRGADRASDGMDTLKDEARDTARETAASFDGSADSIVDMFQETAANALGGFGPAGAAAGLAIAAGAGLAYTAWQENAERIKERVASMYDDLLESGRRYVSASFINEEIANIGRGEGTGAIRDLERAQRLAAAAGADLGDVLRAVSGDADAAVRVQEALNARYRDLGSNAGSAYVDLNGLQHALDETAQSSATAADNADAVRRAQLTAADATRAYAQAVTDADQAVTDANTAIQANNETLTDAQDRAEANRAALADLADELTGVSDAAVDAGVSGTELAAVQDDARVKFEAAAVAAGLTADEAHNLAREFGLVPRVVNTTVDAEIAQAQREVNDFIRDNSGRRIPIDLALRAAGLITSSVPASIAAPARASGGPVTEGRDYVVGEHGPEIFRAPTSGTITPNAALTKPGPVDLSDYSLQALADLLHAHARQVSTRTVQAYDADTAARVRARIRRTV